MSAIITNNAVMHPQEGKCIAISLGSGTQHALDCSAFANNGEMVTIYNACLNVLGYKFSSNPVANINVAALSGDTACSRMQQNTSERGYIPFGCPHLHLQCPTSGYVYVFVSSVNRE